MGVRWLLRWRPAKGAAPASTDEEVLHRMMADLGGRALPTAKGSEVVSVTCTLLKQHPGKDINGNPRPSGPGGLKDVWLVEFRDAKETCYVINRPDHHVLEADTALSRILHAKLEYTTKSTVRFDCKTYTMGDVAVRVCSASYTVSGIGTFLFLGHCLDVEYLPLSHLSVAQPVVSELVDILRGRIPLNASNQPIGVLELMRPSYDKYGSLPAAFCHSYTAVAYAETAVHMLSSGQPPQQAAAASHQQHQPVAAAAAARTPVA